MFPFVGLKKSFLAHFSKDVITDVPVYKLDLAACFLLEYMRYIENSSWDIFRAVNSKKIYRKEGLTV